uniref:Uncharacterized protein n=1 Tax=viral metagenome TaxID=1070528 RepID=A0A6C0HSK7_9ZZZZ
MNSFKPKTDKKIKIFKNDQFTIDGKHMEFLEEFDKNEKEIIPRLKTKILNLQKKTPKTSDEKLDIQDEILLNIQKIKNIKKRKNDYLLKNSKYIFEYFESKQNINENVISNNSLNTFFKLEPVVQDTKSNIIQKYLQNIGVDTDKNIHQKDACIYCLKGEIIPIEDEGLMLCNSCFKNIPYLVENEKPSYKEPPKEVSFYAYKKINHFKEILAQFQGKETTFISDEIINNIRNQIKRERITLEQMTYSKTKEILKKLRYNKYYEHIAFIKNKLGIPPLNITPDMEELLCNLFMELQSPYAKFCPDYRVNFLNYYYILFKLCELLGETKYLNEIPMLKDREKLIEQDDIWKKMCSVLNWDFKPTIY